MTRRNPLTADAAPSARPHPAKAIIGSPPDQAKTWDSAATPEVARVVRAQIDKALVELDAAIEAFKAAGFVEWAECLRRNRRGLALWNAPGNWMDCFDKGEDDGAE